MPRKCTATLNRVILDFVVSVETLAMTPGARSFMSAVEINEHHGAGIYLARPEAAVRFLACRIYWLGPFLNKVVWVLGN